MAKVMSRAVQEAELGDAVGEGRAADAPGVGPAVDALLEEEPVEDELAAPVEQLGQRPPPVGTLEAVVVLDPHHRHALPGGGELVHRGGDGLARARVMAVSAASHSVWLTTGGRATVNLEGRLPEFGLFIVSSSSANLQMHREPRVVVVEDELLGGSGAVQAKLPGRDDLGA